jgi:hypothetical protein
MSLLDELVKIQTRHQLGLGPSIWDKKVGFENWDWSDSSPLFYNTDPDAPKPSLSQQISGSGKPYELSDRYGDKVNTANISANLGPVLGQAAAFGVGLTKPMVYDNMRLANKAVEGRQSWSNALIRAGAMGEWAPLGQKLTDAAKFAWGDDGVADSGWDRIARRVVAPVAALAGEVLDPIARVSALPTKGWAALTDRDTPSFRLLGEDIYNDKSWAQTTADFPVSATVGNIGGQVADFFLPMGKAGTAAKLSGKTAPASIKASLRAAQAIEPGKFSSKTIGQMAAREAAASDGLLKGKGVTNATLRIVDKAAPWVKNATLSEMARVGAISGYQNYRSQLSELESKKVTPATLLAQSIIEGATGTLGAGAMPMYGVLNRMAREAAINAGSAALAASPMLASGQQSVNEALLNIGMRTAVGAGFGGVTQALENRSAGNKMLKGLEDLVGKESLDEKSVVRIAQASEEPNQLTYVKTKSAPLGLPELRRNRAFDDMEVMSEARERAKKNLRDAFKDNVWDGEALLVRDEARRKFALWSFADDELVNVGEAKKRLVESKPKEGANRESSDAIAELPVKTSDAKHPSGPQLYPSNPGAESPSSYDPKTGLFSADSKESVSKAIAGTPVASKPMPEAPDPAQEIIESSALPDAPEVPAAPAPRKNQVSRSKKKTEVSIAKRGKKAQKAEFVRQETLDSSFGEEVDITVDGKTTRITALTEPPKPAQEVAPPPQPSPAQQVDELTVLNAATAEVAITTQPPPRVVPQTQAPPSRVQSLSLMSRSGKGNKAKPIEVANSNTASQAETLEDFVGGFTTQTAIADVDRAVANKKEFSALASSLRKKINESGKFGTVTEKEARQLLHSSIAQRVGPRNEMYVNYFSGRVQGIAEGIVRSNRNAPNPDAPIFVDFLREVLDYAASLKQKATGGVIDVAGYQLRRQLSGLLKVADTVAQVYKAGSSHPNYSAVLSELRNSTGGSVFMRVEDMAKNKAKQLSVWGGDTGYGAQDVRMDILASADVRTGADWAPTGDFHGRLKKQPITLSVGPGGDKVTLNLTEAQANLIYADVLTQMMLQREFGIAEVYEKIRGAIKKDVGVLGRATLYAPGLPGAEGNIPTNAFRLLADIEKALMPELKDSQKLSELIKMKLKPSNVAAVRDRVEALASGPIRKAADDLYRSLAEIANNEVKARGGGNLYVSDAGAKLNQSVGEQAIKEAETLAFDGTDPRISTSDGQRLFVDSILYRAKEFDSNFTCKY